jgi:hypothetical protein
LPRSPYLSNGGFLALDSEQVVGADDVEVLDHRRSVHPALELLQEPQELGDRRPGVLDASASSVRITKVELSTTRVDA